MITIWLNLSGDEREVGSPKDKGIKGKAVYSRRKLKDRTKDALLEKLGGQGSNLEELMDHIGQERLSERSWRANGPLQKETACYETGGVRCNMRLFLFLLEGQGGSLSVF